MVILRAEKWVHEGQCIAHLDGEVYFIKGAIPGELVKVEIIKNNNKFKLTRVVEILESSPDRVQSDCSIYPICGGCSFRHIPYILERQIKFERLLEDGKRNLVPYESISIPFHFGKEIGYRNNFQIQVQGKKKGFFSEHSNQILELPRYGCKNLQTELNQILQDQKKIQKSRKWRFLDTIHPYDQEIGCFSLDGFNWKIPKGGFFQVHTELLSPWLKEIYSWIETPQHILELFSGSGLISNYVANKSISLLGIEMEKNAVDFAKKNAKDNNIKNVNFKSQNLYLEFIQEKDFDFLIANPPRSGLGKLVIQWIQKEKPKQILYSSCNYQTLNRDLKEILQMDYQLNKVNIFDFFPRTPYFETLVLLKK